MTEIYKKDLKSAFCNMTAVVLIAFILFIFGFYTMSINLNYGGQAMGYSEFEYTVTSMASILSLLVIPIITTRSFAEEKHQKTDQLLYSLPIKTPSVVIAKYLSMLTIFAIPVGIISLFPFILSLYGKVYLNTAWATLFAYFLVGAIFIAVGMFISSLTESTVISAILSTAVIILVACAPTISTGIGSEAATSLAGLIIISAIIGVIAYYSTKNTAASLVAGLVCGAASIIVYMAEPTLYEGLIPDIINELDLFTKMGNFAGGIFDITSVVFFISVIIFFVFLTVQSMEKKRWN